MSLTPLCFVCVECGVETSARGVDGGVVAEYTYERLTDALQKEILGSFGCPYCWGAMDILPSDSAHHRTVQDAHE